MSSEELAKAKDENNRLFTLYTETAKLLKMSTRDLRKCSQGEFDVQKSAISRLSKPSWNGTFNLIRHLYRQRSFSMKTFGPFNRKNAVVEHIRKELREIELAPRDLEEWIDVMILSIEGAFRAGYDPEQIVRALVRKQTKNEARTWPDWRDVPIGTPIEHIET